MICFEETPLLINGKAGHPCYRIPAIVQAPNGDLLAFAEERVQSCDDFGLIHIVMKHSGDGGRSWSAAEVVAENGRYVAGNPGVVVDTMVEPQAVWLVYNKADHSEHDIIDNNEGTRRVFVKSSLDSGKTWTPEREITQQVHPEDWRWYGIGPGHGIQLRAPGLAGRLLIPAYHTAGSTGRTQYAHAIWSDDHGQTWILGSDVAPDTGESTAVELESGTVMMNMRNWKPDSNMRAVATSDDGGATWGDVMRDPALTDPNVEGSIARYTKEGRELLLFTNPDDADSRAGMTVRVSYDQGETWQRRKLVRAGDSSYSDLVVLSDGSVGLLYEHGDQGGIHFARFTLNWLLGLDAAVVSLQCMADTTERRWLNGRILENDATLESDLGFEGTQWHCEGGTTDDSVRLRREVWNREAKLWTRRWLNGRMSDEKVTLEKKRGYAGTEWRLVETEPGVYEIWNVRPEERRILAGDTTTGQVTLIATPDPPSTQWRLWSSTQALT